MVERPDETNATSRAPGTRVWPIDQPALTPLIPVVLVVWSDSPVAAQDMAELSRCLESSSLFRDARSALEPWLRVDDPPTVAELNTLRAVVREHADSLSDDPCTLARMGLGLAVSTGWQPGPGEMQDAQTTLNRIEAILGVEGLAATPEVVARKHLPGAPAARPARFDVDALYRFLNADHLDVRKETLDLLETEPLRIAPHLPMNEYREAVLDAVRAIAAAGLGGLAYPPEFGGRSDPGGSIAVFETLAYADLSVLVKFGVQFGLFGGSILQLGTRRHHEAYLSEVGSLALPGCYGMTETGHGSNVRDLETTATFDAASDEFVIQTPTPAAAKDWIGNAALHGRMATVFAQLHIDREGYGVHAFLVPIRDAAGRLMPGVSIEDRGHKEGLDGIDNGLLLFDAVRIPRDNLLDRFAQVDRDGRYASPIPSEGRRFFTMLGTLVAGRISIAAASVSAAKTALTIAIRYGDRRRQFGPSSGPEVPLLDYLAHQRLLLPRLATVYGLTFAVQDMVRRFANPDGTDDTDGTEGPDSTDSTDSTDRQRLEVMAAGIKAYASSHCIETLQACREACGGQGYLSANRFGALKADTDVFTTFEGANPVLLQLTAKGLLSDYKHEMGDLKLWGIMKLVAERAGAAMTDLNPVVTRRTDEDHLRDPDFHHSAFEYREEHLLVTLAQRLKGRIDDGVDPFDAVNQCQDHMMALAEAHVERLILDGFEDAVVRAPSPGLSEALRGLEELYALSTMERHGDWYLQSGYVEPGKSKAIRSAVNRLCSELRDQAVFLVDAFGIPDSVLQAPAGVKGTH